MSEQITPENYFRRSDYMSNSQYRMFLQCPEMALAVTSGAWDYPQTEDMKAGSYADVMLTEPDKVEAWKAANPDIISSRGPTKGQVKAKYKTVQDAVEKVEATPEALAMLQGPDVENQTVLTGEIAGVPWKGLVDAINHKTRSIVDLKCMANLSEDKWNGSERVPWYVAWGYWRQAAIYRELARQMYGEEYTFHLLAVSKESPPDLRGYEMKGAGAYRTEIRTIEANMPHIMAIKSGDVEADMCGNCSYCRVNKPFKIEIAEYA